MFLIGRSWRTFCLLSSAGLASSIVLFLDVVDGDGGGDVGSGEDDGEVEGAGFPVRRDVHEFQHVAAADHVGDGAEAELGHDFAELFGDEEHVVDDVLGLALEFAAEVGVLGGDADGAGVEVADAHHDAAGGDEGGGGEADFFSAQKHGDGDVAAGFNLAVGLQNDSAAEVVHHEHLLGFGNAEFPGNAGILN